MRLLKTLEAMINRLFHGKLLYLIFILLTVDYLASAQVAIKGLIVGPDSLPVVGATIMVKGTNIGTTSDLEGKFTITAKENDVLVITSVGFISREVTVTPGVSMIKSTMDYDLVGLNEVVVVGYGTQRKGDVTSAIASVSEKDFVKGSVRDVGQLLQGKVAGLTIGTPSGNPADGVQILLRGISTLLQDQTPLIIIDGIEGDFSTVAPQDIATIDVLKDGSSSAIYGTRGTNGVIIITTKKGTKNSPLTIEYSGYTSTQKIARRANFYNAADYRSLAAAGVSGFTDLGYTTDWLKEITRTPFSQVHDLSLRGGNDKTCYTASFNYNDAQGIFLKSEVKNMRTRLDVTHSLFDGKASVNMGLLSGTTSNPSIDPTYAYRQACIRNPTDQIKDASGNWVEHVAFQYQNPVAILEETNSDVSDRFNRMYGNLTITPIYGLNLKMLISRNVWNETTGYAETFKNYSTTVSGLNGYATRSASASTDNHLDITGEYSKSINMAHNFSILGGYSYLDNTYETFYMQNENYPTDYFGWNNMGSATITASTAAMTSSKNSNKLIGFFGRFNYNYDNKYLVQASIRHEGSSKFGENNKWGNFPAVQAGWVISKEAFMGNVKFISNLKLRADYGITGVEPYESYLSLTRLTYSGYIYINGAWVKTLIPDPTYGNPNPNLRWEQKSETNLGLDWALFNDRISGTFDLYKRVNKDMLWWYSVSVPPNLASTTLQNVGKMENKGIEATFQVVPIKAKDFTWTSVVTYSVNENKLLSLSNDAYQLSQQYINLGNTGDPIQDYTHRLTVGRSYGEFFGYKVIDIDSKGKWLLLGEEGDTVKDAVKKESDKRVLGNGLPKWYLTWNNSFSYKNFDLSVNMRGAFGFQIINYQRMFYENPTSSYNQLKTSHDLIFGKAVLKSAQEFNSYYVENGDYWKIDNITLGYTLKLKSVKYIKSLRLYASGLNMVTITKYKGIDPEVNLLSGVAGTTGTLPGSDFRDKYPTTRTYTLGVNIQF